MKIYLYVVLILGLSSCDIAEKERQILKYKNLNDSLTMELKYCQSNFKEMNIEIWTKYQGKLPSQSNFFKDKIIEDRIKGILSSEIYDEIAKNYQSDTPFEVKDNVMSSYGMKNNNSIIIAFDTRKNKLHVGFRKEKSEEVYSEDKDHLPDVIKTWRSE